MKSAFFTLSLLFITSLAFGQGTYTCKAGKVTFFSEAPLENIEAFSTRMIGAMNMSTGDVVFRVPIRSFEFDKALMQEHFNENYMESEKYPNATLVAKLVDTPNLDGAGRTEAKVKGTIEIHGVKQEGEFTGTLSYTESCCFNLKATFIVRLEDHNIEIPQMVVKNIAEEIEVKIDCDFEMSAARK